VYGLCGPAAAQNTPPLDAADAVGAWMTARAAIDHADARDIQDVPGLEGVHLVLRHDGRPVATSSQLRAEGSTNPLADAVASLLDQARRDSAVQDLPPALFHAGLASTTLELDAAGPLMPLQVRDLHRAGHDLDPATSGLALRVGDAWTIRFPSALRMSGAAATVDMIGELAAVAGLTPAELTDARQRGQATVYTFQTVDLVQLPGELGPRHFQRGVGQRRWTDEPRPAVAALTLAGRHLVDRLWATPDEGAWVLGGTYHPNDDRWRPMDAPPRERAFAAVALQRLSDIPALPDPLRRQAADRADGLASALPSDDPVIEAAKVAMGRSADTRLVRDLLQDASAPLVERAIAAWALASAGQQPEEVAAFLDQVALLPPSTTLQGLPWIGWTDSLISGATTEPRRMEDLWRGLERVALSDLSPEKITADVLPVAAFLASETQAAGGQSTPTLRVMQLLLVDAGEAAYYRSPERMAGGIKLAAWDERMPLWSQTMGILALCELAEADRVADQTDRQESST
jgi:hypothetical protein